MGQRSKHLGSLQRRADFLAARLAACAPGIDLSYDKSELAALLWVIDQVSRLPAVEPSSQSRRKDLEAR